MNDVVNVADNVHNAWEQWKNGQKRDVDLEARKITVGEVVNIGKTAGGIASDIWNAASNVTVRGRTKEGSG